MIRFIMKKEYDAWEIWDLKRDKLMAEFPASKMYNSYLNSPDLAPLLAGDYCDFLNDKYIDKEINEEWGEVDVDTRIKYHEDQIKLLKSGEYTWNKHRDGVE